MNNKESTKAHKLKDFKSIMSLGNKIITRSFVLLYVIDSQDIEHFEYGIIASKKVGKAVQRNRCKRLLRSAVASLTHIIKPKSKLVLIARSALLEQKFIDLIQSLKWAMHKASLRVPNENSITTTSRNTS